MEEKKTLAHDLENNFRTLDAEINKNVTFESLMLSQTVLAGLNANNYHYPSPIQIKAIPLAKCGRDLFIQAKSGTGKTIVFVIAILERFIDRHIDGLQSLVIVPTREIAIQVTSVLEIISKNIHGFNVTSCIGGVDIEKDRQSASKAKCIVGTPGRILHLINNRLINFTTLELLVLDEADKLISQDAFKNDVQDIIKYFPNRRQMLVVSATMNEQVEMMLESYMKNPLGVTPKKEIPVLLGVTQFIYMIELEDNVMDEMRLKLTHLVKVLEAIDYNQCLIFTNSQNRAESYANYLNEKGYLADFISAALDQSTRLKVFERIQTSPTCRIIVTTDLLARGIDSERVNLVINLELPNDQFCYLHRIGRAGRFGSLGVAITFISGEKEMKKFNELVMDKNVPVYTVKPESLNSISNTLKQQRVPEVFETLSFGVIDDNNANVKPKETDTASQSLMDVFNSYDKFVTTDDNIQINPLPNTDTNLTASSFLEKILKYNIYQEDDESCEMNGQNADKEGNDFEESDTGSAKSTKGSNSSSDNIQESDINQLTESLDNFNTESANDRVDAFLGTLEDGSNEINNEDDSAQDQSESTILNVSSSSINSNNFNIESINKRVNTFLSTIDAQNNGNSNSSSIDEAQESNSGFVSDDESSSSSSEGDSVASNRGSDTYQNGIDESDEEYFEAEDHSPSFAMGQRYHHTHNLWTNVYWNQMKQISEYVNLYRNYRQQTKGF